MNVSNIPCISTQIRVFLVIIRRSVCGWKTTCAFSERSIVLCRRFYLNDHLAVAAELYLPGSSVVGVAVACAWRDFVDRSRLGSFLAH